MYQLISVLFRPLQRHRNHKIGVDQTEQESRDTFNKVKGAFIFAGQKKEALMSDMILSAKGLQ